MDIPQQRYKKTIMQFRPYLNNVLAEYPIPENLMDLKHIRNLKYIIEKEKHTNSFSQDIYQEFVEEIKALLNDKQIQVKLFATKLIRTLPFYYRRKIIQEAGNEISIFLQKQETNVGQSQPSKGSELKGTVSTSSAPEYHYQMIADITDLLLSVYQLSSLSEDIYFDVNQKITSIFSRIIQNCTSADRDISRNCYEVIRAIFMTFGQCKGWKRVEKRIEEMSNTQNSDQETNYETIINTEIVGNKLISKIINIFGTQQNFYLPSNSNAFTNMNHQSSSFSMLRLLILKTRQYQIRLRCRMLTGISYMLTYISEPLHQMYELLSRQVFIILENSNEFDINLQCFLSIKAILTLPLSQSLKIRILKNWIQVLSQLSYSHSYKKQYYQFYLRILKQVSQYKYCPIKIKYFVSTSYLQITNFITQQFSRFIIYKFACKNIVMINNERKKKFLQSLKNTNLQHKKIQACSNIIMNFFQYSWFIDRINQDNDLFRSEFLICLLHMYFIAPKQTEGHKNSHYYKDQIKDILSLCHRLLDWQCSCKEETHIPTIKFAFDLYLQFLKSAAEWLGDEIQQFLQELIQRCNQPKMYLLFKFKLISTFIRLSTYVNHVVPYSETKLDLSFLEGEIYPFMMPKNSKPIFEYEYSLSSDGQIESRKQIQSIKVIMSLLTSVQQIHKEKEQIVTKMIIDYHQYLNRLESEHGSNKDLINCLQSLEADYYFNQCQRNFLIGLIDQQDQRGNNIEYTLEQKIVYSPFQVYESDEEYNIFGNMSPVHLKIRILGSSGYEIVYIEIKKNHWVSLPQMILVISSAVEIKQIPFQSGIIQMKIDRVGLLNFEAWTTEGSKLMLGSGSHRIKSKHRWLMVNHLKIIDGIRSKAFLNLIPSVQEKQSMIQEQLSISFNQMPSKINKEVNQTRKDSCYLTFCFGEPLLLQIIFSKNQIIVTVSSKEIWSEVESMIVEMVDELVEGSAEII